MRILQRFNHLSKNLKQLGRLCGCGDLGLRLLVNGAPVYLAKCEERILLSKGFPKNGVILLRSVVRHALASIRKLGTAVKDDI